LSPSGSGIAKKREFQKGNVNSK